MNPTYKNPNANYFNTMPADGNVSATSPAKQQFINNVAGSPGSYKNIPIKAGTDAYVAEQMKAIDSGNTASNPTSTSSNPTTNVPNNNQNSTNTSTENPADLAFSTYLKSLEQPAEVTEATKYVNNLITQGKLDQEKALGMGETLGFATGEAARVGRQNAITLDAAARGLDALIASNASKKEIAKARYDYEQARLKAETDKNKPFELSEGQSRYEYDPKTNSYVKVASVAKTYAPDSGEKLTVGEKKANAYTDLNRFMVPGAKVNGVPVLDPEGFLTAKAFNALVTAAKEEGISRKEFIQEYASYIGNVNSNFQGYGLTPAEIKMLGGY